MSRYHFHFRVGPLCALDPQGIECASMEEAALQAFVSALDKSRLVSAPARKRGMIEVANAQDELLFRVPLSAVTSSGDTEVTVTSRQGYSLQL